MNKKRTVIFVGLVLSVALGVLASISVAQTTGIAGPPSGDGVQPVWYDDNPQAEGPDGQNTNCAYFDDSWYELRVPSATNGTYTQDGLSVTVNFYNGALGAYTGQLMDWSSNLEIDAVFVKAGNEGNLYTYVPEDVADTKLHGPVNPTNNQFIGISHVSFCYDYELSVEKSATGSFDRTITWELDKSVSPAAHSGFAGDSFQSTWTVDATKNVVEDNYSVTGSILIINPAPFPVDYSVSDLIDGSIAATVDCGGGTASGTVAANSSTTCSYSAGEGDGINGTQISNVATVTSQTPGVEGDSATTGISFSATVYGDGSVTVDDDRDTEGQFPANISSSTTFDYDEEFSCSTTLGDYTGGVDSDNYPNTATLAGDNTNLSANADVDVTCYIWDVSKTADGSYQDQYGWDITKTVDPLSQSGFAGDTLSWEWTITWNSFFVKEINHAVSGVITVDNPAPMELTVDVTDELTGGFAATVTCNDGDGGTDLTIAANSSGTCDYTAEPDSQLAQNTATATRNGVSVSDMVNVNWVKGADVGLDGTISDSNNVSIPVDIGQPYEYTGSHICSTDAGDYTDGSYSDGASNTATITWTGGSDSSTANTSYTCYLWDVSKTAEGSYNDKYRWEINKTVDPESQSGFAGDTLEWTWSITWESFFVEKVNHLVEGVITVVNPADQELTVDVTDELTGGFAATVECNDADMGTSLTLAANSSGTCDYSAEPNSQLVQNTATATRNGVSVSDTVDVNWVQGPDVGLDATISDTNHADIPVDSPQPYKYTRSHTCSTDIGDYAGGSYSGGASNTATITWTGGSNSSTANTSFTCEAGTIDVLKLNNGAVDDSKDWQFALYIGPDGFGGTQVGSTSSTLGDPDGILDFGDPIPALRPDKTYTVCELGVPAAWSTEWSIGGTPVSPYNPNADDNPPEDNGNRCFDVGAGTSYPVEVGQNLRIAVDNQPPPGGEPRTPGYWKNWNLCSGGNQAETAAKNGGPDEGFFLLDDLLPITIDGFEVSTCEDGVNILDQRDFITNKKMAKYADWAVARNLLAAKLNLAAGAETCTAVTAAVAAADALLADVGFDGHGGVLRPNHDRYHEARDLASTLDQYNNGLLCSP